MRMSATRTVCARSCAASMARLLVAVWLNEPHMMLVTNAEDRERHHDLDQREAGLTASARGAHPRHPRVIPAAGVPAVAPGACRRRRPPGAPPGRRR